MTQPKLIGASVLLLGLLGFCVYLNRDWFASEGIQIFHRDSPRPSAFGRRRAAPPTKVNPVIFGFNRRLTFKSIKVVFVSEIATNKYPHPLWEMASSSNSIPLRNFEYGQWIPGMRPKVANAQPDSLEPGVAYRLLVETAASEKAQHDFTPVPKTP